MAAENEGTFRIWSAESTRLVQVYRSEAGERRQRI